MIPQGNHMAQSVRELQRELYRSAKSNPKRSFYTLHDKIYRLDVLVCSWKQVCANHGAPGIDGITIEQIKEQGEEAFLGQVQKELESGSYRSNKTKRVEIPKPKGGIRILGVPTIKDRLVQTATRLVIEPIFEADFQECSFGFRPKRSAVHASLSIYKWLNYGLTQVLDIDLKRYFDSIPHDKLMKVIQKRISDRYVLKLIQAWLRSGVLKGEEVATRQGSPQGSPISPLLSNIYLNLLDTVWVKRMTERNGWNAQIVRYADDLVIVSNKPVEKILGILCGYLQRLGLSINEEKSRMTTAEEGFNFLGYAFKRGYSPRYQKPVTHMYPTPDAIKRIIKKVTQLTYRNRLHESVETIVKDLNASLLGWTEYYRHTASSRRFRKVQGHANRRLRRFIMKKKGSRKNGYKELPDEKLHKVYKLVNVGAYRVRYRWT
ncbi:group II intron reverse transcriptase/maturase [Cardinium endosymbiont of Sogatella furcifera]|uniref:group II intron reverse transcriptase/maturase n=1 Tax=Cardinium endosymbiont of Sogatella furcifera TaxID=650378 RepID=UPI000E0D48B6|nr:group II intron reverse transcriptase/maturase [Cardinium endosymbiont of Sogatella furcifera]AXI24013.1 group II intron reverse transcriptase [Cardinium endosymbiont of Sogatella furcifera]AXI24068.1 group II intron reverse transcriptase/maturase [Cardinium endosymbiont of Sogatella furcifera]AXI24083.1 group II intron reverse transcriptase/maturase [Cardinium endosymbiont of Sogatella furcifera]AXI24265.1 group II intron reverse transcriptase/maturase [Cardinium endosymbiont of Sogatella f